MRQTQSPLLVFLPFNCFSERLGLSRGGGVYEKSLVW